MIKIQDLFVNHRVTLKLCKTVDYDASNVWNKINNNLKPIADKKC